MKYADLHIHTRFSDGGFTPEEAVRQAQDFGLSCIAITDHDTVSGIKPALKEAKNLNIEVIPAVELSAEIDNYEIHILGYFIDWQAKWFQDKLKTICAARKKRALAIVERLKRQGASLKLEELLQQAGPGSIGRLHIARMLEKKGFVSSTQEAFNKYIGNGRSCYVKNFKVTAREAIEMIRRLKGVAVLAHPYHIGNDEVIAELVQLGLKGIEAYYPEYGQATSQHYKKLAKKYGLLVTGGSDSHSAEEAYLKIPYELVEALKKEAQVLKDEK